MLRNRAGPSSPAQAGTRDTLTGVAPTQAPGTRESYELVPDVVALMGETEHHCKLVLRASEGRLTIADNIVIIRL